MRMKSLVCLFFSIVSVMGCSSRKTTVGLDVDLYLHPESSKPEDVILQAAIRKRLADSDLTRQAILHVQVVEGTVLLSGSVKSQAAKDQAAAIAETTDVSLNGTHVDFTKPVVNRIDVAP